jgi:hypothetical protein
MRRWLSALLLALMSFQLSWAAVAPYCEHEDALAGHFGHHQHQHQQPHPHDFQPDDERQHPPAGHDHAAGFEVQPDDTARGDASGMDVHLDCPQCHGPGVGLALLSLAAMASVPQARPSVPVVIGTASAGFERPERPNWSRPA